MRSRTIVRKRRGFGSLQGNSDSEQRSQYLEIRVFSSRRADLL